METVSEPAVALVRTLPMMWKIGRNGCSERGWQVFGSADELARCASSSASIGASIEAAIGCVVRSKMSPRRRLTRWSFCVF